MFQVKDDKRILQFEGVHIAHASSQRRGVSDRWVEFDLFRTTGGNYILGRVGRTTLYHGPDCRVTKESRIKAAPVAILTTEMRPCEVCRPEQRLLSSDQDASELIYPEQPRYWASVCDSAVSVVDSLYQFGEDGTRYLTMVARRLLEAASEQDLDIDQAYRIETVA